MDHLVEHHKLEKFAFYLHRPSGKPFQVWEHRYEAFVERLKHHKIPEENIYVIEKTEETEEPNPNDFDQFFKDHAGEEIGIGCQDDRHAGLICNYMVQNHIPIGANYKIVGFGNFHGAGKFHPLPVTTASVPVGEMGEFAITWLQSAAKGNFKAFPVKLDPPLIIRNTCGCIDHIKKDDLDAFGKPKAPKPSLDDEQNDMIININKALWRLVDTNNEITASQYMTEHLMDDANHNDPISIANAGYSFGVLEERYRTSTRIKEDNMARFFGYRLKNFLSVSTLGEFKDPLFAALDFLKVKSCLVLRTTKDVPIENYQRQDEPTVRVLYNYKKEDDLRFAEGTEISNWRLAAQSYSDERHNLVCLPLYSSTYYLGNILLEISELYGHHFSELSENVAERIFFIELLEKQVNTIAKLDKTRAELKRMSTTDDLTQINNRRGFLENAQEMYELLQRNNTIYSVVFIDLDYLKVINDSFGHAAGDWAIKTIAQTMRDTLRTSDVIGRFGGDEFVALTAHKHKGDGAIVKKRFLDHLAKINEKSGKDFILSASVGIYTGTSTKKKTLEDILSLADAVLYQEKAKRSPLKLRKA